MNSVYKFTLENETAHLSCTLSDDGGTPFDGWVSFLFQIDVTPVGSNKIIRSYVPVTVPYDATDMDVTLALVVQLKTLSSKPDVKEAQDPKTAS